MGVAGTLHLVVFGLLLPLAAFAGKRKLEKSDELPPRGAYFASALLQLVLFGSISAAVARFEGIWIFPPAHFTAQAIGLAAGIFALHAFVGQYRARLRVRQRDRKLWLLMPMNGPERAQWVGIALAAALGEEITYRGVLIELVQRLGAGFPLAVAICALGFGLAPAMQGWKAVAIITAYAVWMHLLVALSGSLYLGMLVHFLHDLWIGLFVAWLAKREGWDPQVQAAGNGSP